MPFYGPRVEYALHTLLNLSLAPGEIAPSARDLAEFQRLSIAFMQKLLTRLEKAGLIVGAEGVRGGWHLARPPDAITALEVADAAQGNAPLFECRNIRARCALWRDGAAPATATSGVCSIHAIMLAAERALRDELAGHTLADIARQMQSKISADRAAAIPRWFATRYRTRRSRDASAGGAA